MTREERIKEMAELTFDYVDSKDVSKLYLMGSNADKKIRPLLHNYGLAEFLYNACYRKVPDGAVILTKEEQEKHITMTKVNYKSIMRQLNQARKETAKEILNEVDNESNGKTISITNYLRKKYGV